MNLNIKQPNEISKKTPYNIYLSTILSTLLLFSASVPPVEARSDIETTGGVFRTTFEELSLTGNEKMGLSGGSFLYETGDLFSVGPGVYSALTGKRGGFITLGLAGEANKQFNDQLTLSAGLFVGAGGGHGGYSLSGGGLMLRPHAGIVFNFRDLAHIGAGVSHVEFPDGSISSTQPYVAVEVPFEMLIDSWWSESSFHNTTASSALPSSEREISIVYRRYFVTSDARTSSGEDQHGTIGLVGARWRYHIDSNFFLALESHGAMQGESNGFMQILFGGGCRYRLSERSRLIFSAGIGTGGGGGVDTGGGLIVDGSVSLQQYLSDSFFLSASGGYVDAPDGSFEAIMADLQIGYNFSVPTISEKKYQRADLVNYDRRRFRVRTVHQTYLKGNDRWKTHHPNENVDNLGLQIDYFPIRTFYLSGQGLAAYGSGHAGAYMTGLLGAGLHYPLGKTPAFIDLEALAGAAGGGGVEVGGGFVWQANAGIGIEVTDAFSLHATVGHISAPSGEFDANVLGASIGYRFTVFGKKSD